MVPGLRIASAIVAGGLAASGCGAGGAAYRGLHAAACAGNIEAFARYVDTAALVENGVNRAKGGASSVISLDAVELRAIGRKVIEEMSIDIARRRDASSVCGWRKIREESAGGAEQVEVRTRVGNRIMLHFSKRDGALVLTDYVSEDGTSWSFR